MNPLGKRHALRHGHTSRLHGRRISLTYSSWQAMRARCGPSQRDNSDRYRDKGITVCEEWSSFDAFLRDMGERPDGKSLDRISNLKGYCKTNCKWSTANEQARNMSSVKLTLETATQVAVRRLRGETCLSIAQAFGICESLPREIVRGRIWADALAAAKEIVNGAD